MERRSALKNMGLVFGYAVATPTLLGLLQSCKDKPAYAEWTPKFLGPDQGYALAMTLDVILPKTDSPSATEVNVHTFIDALMDEVMPLGDRDFVVMRMGKFFDKALADAGKENLRDLEPMDLEPVLAATLKKFEEREEQAHFQAILEYRMAVEEEGKATLDDEISRISFANELRSLATWAYKSSEYVGEEVLAYLPIPAEYLPCEDLQELTQGKAWSL